MKVAAKVARMTSLRCCGSDVSHQSMRLAAYQAGTCQPDQYLARGKASEKIGFDAFTAGGTIHE